VCWNSKTAYAEHVIYRDEEKWSEVALGIWVRVGVRPRIRALELDLGSISRRTFDSDHACCGFPLVAVPLRPVPDPVPVPSCARKFEGFLGYVISMVSRHIGWAYWSPVVISSCMFGSTILVTS